MEREVVKKKKKKSWKEHRINLIHSLSSNKCFNGGASAAVVFLPTVSLCWEIQTNYCNTEEWSWMQWTLPVTKNAPGDSVT